MKYIVGLSIGITVVLALFVVWFYFVRTPWDASTTGNYDINILEVGAGDSLPEGPGYYEKFMYAAQKLTGIGTAREYLVVIDVSEQREYVFSEEGDFVDIYTVSTGSNQVYVAHREGTETGENGTGIPGYEDHSMLESVWKVVSKKKDALSPIYGPRLIMLDRWTGKQWISTEVGLHGTNDEEILGTPVSLGCVYHRNADIIELYDLISIGTFVVAIP